MSVFLRYPGDLYKVFLLPSSLRMLEIVQLPLTLKEVKRKKFYVYSTLYNLYCIMSIYIDLMLP